MPVLFDPTGKPIDFGSLDEERVTGSITSIRNPFDPEVALGLTPARLVALLRNAKGGDHYDYLSLAREMEQRDTHYFSMLQTRKLAIQELDRQVDASSEDTEDEDIAGEVRSFIDSENFAAAINDILDAVGKGFSVTEIMWERGPDRWTPKSYDWKNPRWFQFDMDTATELRLYDGSADGEELQPYKYIIHAPHVVSGISLAGGLARIVAVMHLFKGYILKDWMAFAEVFGMPIRIGKYEQGATTQDKNDLKRAVRDIGSDAAAIIPRTMEIIFERASMSGNAGSDKFFSDTHADFNKEISKVVLGQTMTSEDGSSLAQAEVHDKVRADIRNADARQLAATINRDLIRPFVDLNFGVRARDDDYPKFSFDIEEPADLMMLAQSLPPFVQLGLPVPIAWLLEKFAIPEQQEGEELLQAAVSAAPGGDDDDGVDAQNMRALLHWVQNAAQGTTNMRVFRKMLAEKLGGL